MSKTRTFANVWDAIEDSSDDAATMTMRSNVMIAIEDTVRSGSTTQAQAARRLGITQPRSMICCMGRSTTKAGRLERLAEQALADFRAGRAREL